MKWRSHRQITELVAEALELPDELAELLIEASVDPDRNALKRVEKRRGRYTVKRVRHHRHSGDELIRLLWRARESYLDGDDEDAVWRLGRGLHYIQDSVVDVGARYANHDLFEEAAASIAPSRVTSAKGLKSSIPSPEFVRVCVKRSRPCRDAETAVERATLMSAAIAGAVLGDVRSGEMERQRFRRIRRRHNFLLIPSAILTFAFIAVLAFEIGVPYLLLLGLPVGAAIVLSDRRYYFELEEARWNGIWRR